MLRTLALVLLALLLPALALATDWTVGTTGDYPTLRWALVDTANVTRGDTLTLLAGQTHRLNPVAAGTPPKYPALHHRMVLRGENANVVARPIADDYGVIVAGLNIEIRDLTIRSVCDTVPPYTVVPLTGSGVFSNVTTGTSATYRNVRFRGIKANSSGVSNCVVAEYEGWDQANSVRFVDCVFDSCTNAGGTNSRGPIAYQNAQRAAFDGCVFSNCSAGRAPVYYTQAEAEPDVNSDYIVRGCLFANNSSSNTASGGALHILLASEAAYVDTAVISHCTFYNNNATTSANGDIYTSGSVTASTAFSIDHCVFYGNGTDYVMRNPPGGVYTSAKYSDAYNCGGSNTFYATTISDTIQINPEFVTTALDSTRKFMPRSCTVGGDGCSVRVTDETPASYMGYIDPATATAIPTLSSPANGAASPLATMVVDWASSAYADSFAVRWGTNCGTGTYDATMDTTSTATLSVTPNTTYWWQVRELDCGGWGQWSACRCFGAPAGGRRVGVDGLRNFRLRGR
jgi:hypothetical protein